MFDEQMRSFLVQLRVGGLPGIEPVDVAVEHAEGCRDENGVVNLDVRCAFAPCRFDVRARDGLAIDCDLAGNVQQCAKLGIDRRVVRVALDLFDGSMPPSSWTAAKALCECSQNTVLLRLET